MKRILIPTILILIVLFGAWIGEIPFTKRGPEALGIYVLSLLVGAIGYAATFTDDFNDNFK